MISTSTLGQSPILSFDGIDDYVDLGPDVGNNARTIEFWFNSSETIDASLSDFKGLVTREVSATNENDWDIHFIRKGLALPAGAIRFTIHETVNKRFEVVSDSTKWNANQWYHVAAVVDESRGMMLFIDGIKQKDTLSTYVNATTSVKANTEVARWGSNQRHFAGKIEDVRISSNSLYTENFNPPCPDIKKVTSTIGLYNFNENMGSIATDSANNNHGTVYGATWDTAFICGTVNLKEVLPSTNEITIYPNPSSGNLTINISDTNFSNLEIEIYNSIGQVILRKSLIQNTTKLDLTSVSSGMYHYRVTGTNSVDQTGKLIKY